MKLMSFFTLVFVNCILFSTTAFSGDENIKPDTPLAVLPVARYEFEPTLEGAVVLHDFIIRNKGNAPLDIEKVKTD